MTGIDRAPLLAGLRQMVREESQHTARAAQEAAVRGAALLPEIQEEVEEEVRRAIHSGGSGDGSPAAREESMRRLALQILVVGRVCAEQMEEEIRSALAEELGRLREIAVTLDRVHAHLYGVWPEAALSAWLDGFGARHHPRPGLEGDPAAPRESAYGAGWLAAGLGLAHLTATLPVAQDGALGNPGDPGSHRRAVLERVASHFREGRSRLEEEVSAHARHLFAQVQCGLDDWLDRMEQEPEGAAV